MEALQAFVARFGLGISKEKLISKAYFQLSHDGHDCCIINGIYICVDGEELQVIKSRRENRWIVKPLWGGR